MIAQADPASLQVTSIKIANYAARSGELVQCDASAGSFTVTLPGSPRVNQIVGVKLLETTGGNSVTIARNGNAIEGEAGDLSLSEAGEYLELQYNGAGNWIDRTEHESSGNSAVATITANTTLTLNQEVVLCNNTSNITVTLPTAVGNSGKPYTLKKIGNNSATVTIDAAGSETIDGAATLVLYIQKDFLGIVSDGSNWQVVDDGRIAHGAMVYLSSDRTLTNNGSTRYNFNAAIYDIGGIADITTDGRIEIRRSGRYNVSAFAPLTGIATSAFNSAIVVNGGGSGLTFPGISFPISVTSPRITASASLNLSEGDFIDYYVFQASGATRNSGTGTVDGPWMSVNEIL